MAIRIDGKEIAQKTRQALIPRIEKLKAQGVTPGLTVVLVGEDPASAIYVRNKERTSMQLGFNGNVIRLPEATTQQQLLEQVEALNKDPGVHGILVQMPLPEHIDESAVLKAIDPDKDVDSFHAVNAGRVFQGKGLLLPCTPFGVMRMLEACGIDPSGKEAVIIGRSNIVGKPMAMLLLKADATVTIAHSRTKNLAEVARRADILVAAVGRPRFVTADMVKPGAVVIDVGVNRVGEKKVVGDVDFDAVEPIAGWITPVPGGVGPMTITMLMENTVLAAELFAKHG